MPSLPADLEALLGGEVPPGAVPVIARLVRRVLRFELPDGRTVYAKQHLFPSLRVRLRYALRASPTRHEATLLQAARRCGLRVPSVVAERTSRGWLGPRLAVLVTEALPAGQPMGPRAQLAAVLGLAEHGFFHPDMHPDNLRLVAGEPCYLDLQSCRRQRRPVGGRRRVRMVAKMASALRSTIGDAELSGLLVDLGLPPAAVLQEAEHLEARQRTSARRHRLRASTRVAVEPAGMGGRRFRLRHADLPTDYEDEVEMPVPGLGRCRVAASADGSVVRIRRRGCLRRLWLAAATPPPETPEILGWGRDAPWPWALQSLYIRGPMGGAEVAMALDRSLGWLVTGRVQPHRRSRGAR